MAGGADGGDEGSGGKKGSTLSHPLHKLKMATTRIITAARMSSLRHVVRLPAGAIVGEIARGKGRELRATASDESLPSSLYPSPSTRKASDFAADAPCAVGISRLSEFRKRAADRTHSTIHDAIR